MPITEINQLPSRNNPETFAVDTEVTFDQLAQAIRDINDIGSIINTQITGASTTSLTIGTGSKSLTVQAGLGLVPGYPVRIAYTTTPTDNMDGTVTTYDSSTGALVANVASVNGSGTYANWQVMVLPSATGNFADKSTANTFTDVQTFSGGVSANPLIKKQSDPTLGGALLLEKSSGSSLGGNLKFELSGNSIRIYENGGSNRGVTLDVTTLAASIADKILTTASLKNATNDSTFSSTSATDAVSPEWVRGLTKFTKEYISPNQTITLAGLLTLAHGFSSKPKFFELILKCKTAELGYSIGDELVAQKTMHSGSNNVGVSITFDTSNVYIRIGAAGSFSIINKTTGNSGLITATNWDLILKAWA